jgi:hypothetical protein
MVKFSGLKSVVYLNMFTVNAGKEGYETIFLTETIIAS